MRDMQLNSEQIEDTNKVDEEKKPKKAKWIIVIILLLLAGMTLTVAILASRIKPLAADDSDVIALVTEEGEQGGSVEGISETVKEGEASPQSAEQEQNSLRGTRENTEKKTAKKSAAYTLFPDVEVSDGQKVWTTDTEVEIFHIEYLNGVDSTVHTSNGDKLIAPGTENTYVFKLKNTGEVPIDYTVKVEAYIEPANIFLPIEGRMRCYDGNWMVGSAYDYEDILMLDGATDSASLGVNKYAYYELEWRWPFESGRDEYDTWLGNEAILKDITLTIRIQTIATGDAISVGNVAATGDDSKPLLYLALAGGALILIFLLILLGRKKEEKEEQKQPEEKEAEQEE